MNTTIDTRNPNLAKFVMNFCVDHAIDAKLVNTSGLFVIHCALINPFHVTKLQDRIMSNWFAHDWNMEHAVAV